MNSKISAAALGLSVMVGGAAGVALGTPSLAGAQETVDTPSTENVTPDATDQDAAGNEMRGARSQRGGQRLDTAAGLLGLDAEELSSQVEAGADIRSLLEDAGVTREDVSAARSDARAERLAAAVESGELTQAEADEKVAASAERQADREARQAARTETLASVLGISTDDIASQKEAGSSFAEIVEAAGGDVDAVRAELQTERVANVASQVESGDLTQEQADERIERIESGEGRGQRGSGQGNRGMRGAAADTAVADA